MFFYRLAARLVIVWLRFKWFVLGGYYSRLLSQAYWQYKQSELFKLRWQELGLEFAEEKFKDDAEHFLWKVHSGPAIIRRQIFWDWVRGRPFTPYYLSENPE